MQTPASVHRRTIVPALLFLLLPAASAHAQSTSVWLEAECASVGSLWNRTNDASASNSQYVTIQPGNNSTANAPANATGHITSPSA